MNLHKFPDFEKIIPEAGIEGSNALRLDFSISAQFKQMGLRLVAGENYRIGGYVRTKNLKYSTSALLLYNHGWAGDVRSPLFPENTNGEWVKIEADVTMLESRTGLYNFSIYASNASGEFEICLPFVIPLSEKAKAESKRPEKWQNKITRIIPVSPRLTEVNAEKPEMTFLCVYPLEGGDSDYQYRVRAKSAAWKDFPPAESYEIPADRRLTVFLGELQEGEGKIQVEIVKKNTAEIVLANEYSIRVNKQWPDAGRQKNNFVTELLHSALENRQYSFVNPRDGWVFLGFNIPQTNAVAYLDEAEEPTVHYRLGEPSDSMRFLQAGRHTLRVEGAEPGAELSIRAVPEIALFPLTTADEKYYQLPYFNGRFFYDLDFLREYVWHSYNTYILNLAWTPKTTFEIAAGKEFQERGFRLLGSGGFGAKTWQDPVAMEKDIRGSIQVQTTDGRCLDETDPAIVEQMTACGELGWNMADYDKLIYTWIGVHATGFMNYTPLHTLFLSGASNISRGQGKILLEIYATSTPDERSMKKYAQCFPEHLRFAKKCLPDAAERVMVMISGYLVAGAWNCNAYPQTDIKYFLDYCLSVAANDPELKGLAGFGCYDVKYLDEENMRWMAELMRHYCVDGETTMLSDKFGYRLNPGHLSDGDFINGFSSWQAIPAEADSLQAHSINGYGARYQVRKASDPGNGDNCALFIRSAKKQNILSQTAKNLIPGELYSLSFVTADPDDIANAKNRPQQFEFRATLAGAEILPGGYEFRLPRGWDGSWGQKPGRRELVTHKIVFRALKPEVGITFSDWEKDSETKGEIGQKRILNFVSLRPYYAITKKNGK